MNTTILSTHTSRENNIKGVNIMENENNTLEFTTKYSKEYATKYAEKDKKIKEGIFDNLYGINYNRAKRILEECIEELGSVSFIKN